MQVISPDFMDNSSSNLKKHYKSLKYLDYLLCLCQCKCIKGIVVETFLFRHGHDHTKYKRITEAVVRRCSVKKVFLELLQNSQESTCARVPFLSPAT